LVLYNGDNLDSIVNDYKINKLNEHFTEFEKIKEEMKKNEINLEKVLTISGIEQTDEMVEFKKIIDVLKNRLIDSKSKCEDALEEYSIAKQKIYWFF
jgi:16S rRNA C1402 (ribose-2'-O) methylase RsmI